MVNIDYLYNPEAAKVYFDDNYFVDKKLGFQVIEHGTILPYKHIIDGKTTIDYWGYGGIVDKNGKFIKSSHVHYGAGSYYTPPPESIQHRSETVIYLGMFHSTWGHVITDNIRRLWFLKSEFFNQFKNCPLVYLVCTKREAFPFGTYKAFKRLLEVLEIDADTFQLIEQPTHFEKIILPDESFITENDHGRRKFTKEYREAIDQIRSFGLKRSMPTSSKKIYFFYGHNQLGEERMADYFKSKGYEIIRHEQRADFDEELNLLINAESFASPIGSCAHNSLFLRDGAEAILIPRFIHKCNVYQRAINAVHPMNANYVDSSLSVFNSICFIISKPLKSFFGDKWDGYKEEDFKIFLQYVKDSLNRGSSINSVQRNYCSMTFSDFMAQLKRRKDLIAAYDMPPHWETFQPPFGYQTHVHKKGWGDGYWKGEKEFSNPLDQMLDILAIKVNFPNHKVYYSVYFNDKEGWSAEVSNREKAGTVGVHKPIYGMRVRLDEAGAKEFNILYRMHKFDGTWTPWAKNGEALYSHSDKLNAIQMKLEPIKPKVSDTNAKDTDEFDYANMFLVENDEMDLQNSIKDLTQIKLESTADKVYLQGQRQNLTQRKSKPKTGT